MGHGKVITRLILSGHLLLKMKGKSVLLASSFLCLYKARLHNDLELCGSDGQIKKIVALLWAFGYLLEGPEPD